MYSDIKARLKSNAEYTEKCLDSRMKTFDPDSKMAEAMRYSLLGGGKRIRAFLVLEFAQLFGGKPESAEPYACALEMVHAYSLIHDDLPCMDNDDLRRGKPSCHKAYGEATALLAGDALLTFAFETAAEGKNNVQRAVHTLAECAGAKGMCRGQELDLSCECDSFMHLEKLHNLKTGALINAAATLGYYASSAEITDESFYKINNYAYSVGLAFQIIDDLLDVRSTEGELGKPIGSDMENGKKTVLSFMSEDEADAKALQLSQSAAEIFRGEKNSEIICDLPMYLYKRTK